MEEIASNRGEHFQAENFPLVPFSIAVQLERTNSRWPRVKAAKSGSRWLPHCHLPAAFPLLSQKNPTVPLKILSGKLDNKACACFGFVFKLLTKGLFQPVGEINTHPLQGQGRCCRGWRLYTTSRRPTSCKLEGSNRYEFSRRPAFVSDFNETRDRVKQRRNRDSTTQAPSPLGAGGDW